MYVFVYDTDAPGFSWSIGSAEHTLWDSGTIFIETSGHAAEEHVRHSSYNGQSVQLQITTLTSSLPLHFIIMTVFIVVFVTHFYLILVAER